MLDTCWPLQLWILLLAIRLAPLRLVPPTQAVEINRFHCDTKERIEQIQNLKYYLKRFIRHDNRIYFVLSDRVIFMELQLDKEQIDQNLYKFFNSEDDPVEPVKAHNYDLYHYVSFDLYEQENEEILLPDAVPNRFKVFGHIYEQKRNKINKTVEFYAVHQKDLYPDRTTAQPLYQPVEPVERRAVIERFEMFNQSYRLNFELKHPNSVLAERDGPEEARYLSQIFLNPRDGQGPQFANIVYFNRIFVVNSGGQGMDLAINVLYDQFEFNSTYTEAQLAAALIYQNDDKEKVHQTYLLSNKHDYWLFVFYMRDMDFGYQLLYNYQPIYFVGFDESSLFEFSVYNFFQNKHQLVHQVIVDPNELFDCFTKLTHVRQLKGVFYDRNRELFFVFIKRFYLRIHKIDLVDTEFVLENDWYTQKADRLVHRQPAIEGIFEKIDPEFLGRKWVKEIGPNAYYTPDNRNFFLLAVREKDKLTIRKTSGSGFESCYHQTLLVDEKHVFCFRKREYFFLYSLGNESYSHYWNKKRNSIAGLFEETALDWTNQELLLIFNYKEDRFVMLTQSDLFIFEYKKFTLSPGVTEEEHKIRYLHDLDNKRIKRRRNCLLLGCKRPDSSTDSSLTTPIDEPTDSHMALTLLFLVLLAIILSVLVLSVFVNHVFRSNLFSRYNKYFRQPKAKDSNKARSGKSDKKKKYKFTMKVKR